jgi:DNA-3-methyladenine glycosylase II
MHQTFSAENFHKSCDQLAVRDEDLSRIQKAHGYPPMWTRPNSFETLVHIILEQQVSLASALAALHKLQEHTGGLSPAGILAMTDEELRSCYVSRQKTGYLRGLASAIETGRLSLLALEKSTDDEVRKMLTAMKGIGNWTADIYLMFVLRRADIFPIGDLAAVNALKRAKSLPSDTPREKLLAITEPWSPYRTIATMILWHHYLSAPFRAKPGS